MKRKVIRFVDQSPEDCLYHFHSQNVFLTNVGPSHLNVTDHERLFIAYDNNRRVDFHAKINKNEVIFERTIPLLDYNIQQIVHSALLPEYLALLVTHQDSDQKAVHIYTNLFTPDTAKLDKEFAQSRFDRELYDAIRMMHQSNDGGESATSFCGGKKHSGDTSSATSSAAAAAAAAETSPDRFEKPLNVIEFRHPEIPLHATFISACPVNGNFLILLHKKMLLYQRVQCTLPVSHVVTVDFLLSRIITVPWAPEIAQITFNYVAFMSPAHFSMIHVDIDRSSHVYHCSSSTVTSAAAENDDTSGGIKRVPVNEIVYHRLMDGADYNGVADNHPQMIFGPVGPNVGCQIECRPPQTEMIAAGVDQLNGCHLMFCRRFYDTRNPPRKIPRAQSLNFRISRLVPNDNQDPPVYSFEMVPFREADGVLFALVLYVMWSNEISCYIVDLRRDHMRLAPISKIVSTTGATFKGFSVSILEDLIHVVTTEHCLDTYVTHLHPFLAADHFEPLSCRRPIKRMFKISSNHFLNIIATLSTPYSFFLVSEENANRHTIYNLCRPQFDRLQGEIWSKIDDIKSVCPVEPNENEAAAIESDQENSIIIVRPVDHEIMFNSDNDDGAKKVDGDLQTTTTVVTQLSRRRHSATTVGKPSSLLVAKLNHIKATLLKRGNLSAMLKTASKLSKSNNVAIGTANNVELIPEPPMMKPESETLNLNENDENQDGLIKELVSELIEYVSNGSDEKQRRFRQCLESFAADQRENPCRVFVMQFLMNNFQDGKNPMAKCDDDRLERMIDMIVRRMMSTEPLMVPLKRSRDDDADDKTGCWNRQTDVMIPAPITYDYDNDDLKNFRCTETTANLPYKERIRQPYYYLYSLTKFATHCPLPHYNVDQLVQFNAKIRAHIEETFADAKEWMF